MRRILHELLGDVAASASPDEYLEIFARRVESAALVHRAERPDAVQRTDEWEFEVRSSADGRTGMASTTVGSADGLFRARDTARRLRTCADPDVEAGEQAPRWATGGPASADLADPAALRAVVRQARRPGVTPTVVHSLTTINLVNSLGQLVQDQRGEAQLHLRAAPPGAQGTCVARALNELDVSQAVEELAQSQARLAGDRADITSVDWLRLSPLATAQLLSHLAPALCRPGDGDGEPIPPGTPVGSSAVTIVDDGTRAGGPAGGLVDEEGAATRRTDVVMNGVLRTQLGGRGAWSTGNARRAGWRMAITVAPWNLAVQPTTGMVEHSDGVGMHVDQVTGIRRRVVDLRSTKLQLTLRGAATADGRAIGRLHATVGATGQNWLTSISEIGGAIRFYRVGGMFGGAESILKGLPLEFV